MNSKLNIEYLPIAELKPYTANAKLHPPPQIKQIVRSIREFGFNDPIAIDEKSHVIIEGHGRLLAAQELGINILPVIKLGHLTPVQQKAYRIAHNKLTMNSNFDIEIIERELIELKEEGYDIVLTGFDKVELTEMEKYSNQGTNIQEKEYNENINTENKCPKCGYEW